LNEILPIVALFKQDTGFAQLDLSAGAFYRNDITFRENADKEPAFKDDPDHYLGYAISLNKLVDNHVFGVEFQYYTKTLELGNRQVDTDTWYHGEFSDITRKYLSGQVKYGYLGTRFHLSQLLRLEKNNSLVFGGFFQVDALVMEKESNHRDSTIRTNTGVSYDDIAEEKIYYSNTTYYPVSYEVFDFVNMKKVYITLGVNLGHRHDFKRFYTDFRGSLGVNFCLPRFAFRQHVEDLDDWYSDESKTIMGFYQFDFKVGYSF
jgi:hypothetical protein